MGAEGNTPVAGSFGEPAQPYPEHLYDFQGLADGTAGWESVGPDQVRQFHEQGFLVVHQAFTPGEVQGAMGALADLLTGKHPDFNGIEYEASTRDRVAALPPAERESCVRKFWKFVEYDRRLQELSQHPQLLDALGRLMGDVPELFQDMAMLKPPQLGREKPWHQDLAYFRLPIETCVVGAWIALDPATVENGCMEIIPGSHRKGPVVHFKRRDWQICDHHVSQGKTLAVPLEPGGCLLFHGLLHHGTPANRSPLRRRALQFHYKPASVPWGTDEQRLRIFGEEGKNVRC